MADGTTNEAMPCLPCYTPSNWATLATGAWPGTHGATNWYDGRPPIHLSACRFRPSTPALSQRRRSGKRPSAPGAPVSSRGTPPAGRHASSEATS
ncbi:MAG: alkaline phosphatase family protein [Chloroflexota bacterium]